MEIILIWCVIGGGIGAAIGLLGGKDNALTGLILGILLGPVGWIITAIVPKNALGLDADDESPKPNGDAAKIERMEKELAELKRKQGYQTGKAKGVGETDERGIPTYKL